MNKNLYTATIIPLMLFERAYYMASCFAFTRVHMHVYDFARLILGHDLSFNFDFYGTLTVRAHTHTHTHTITYKNNNNNIHSDIVVRSINIKYECHSK